MLNGRFGRMLKGIGVGVASLSILALLALASASVMEPAPPNATVALHYPSLTYASPPCITADTTETAFATVTRRQGRPVDFQLEPDVALVSLAEARAAKAVSDRRCNSASGFTGSSQPMWHGLLGITRQSRWDEDGNWRW